jgi:hypothetical protein
VDRPNFADNAKFYGEIGQLPRQLDGDRTDAASAADDQNRPRSVDERIVGRKPRSLDFPAVAALPLTSITAWEAMFARLDVARPVPGMSDRTRAAVSGESGGSFGRDAARRASRRMRPGF